MAGLSKLGIFCDARTPEGGDVARAFARRGAKLVPPREAEVIITFEVAPEDVQERRFGPFRWERVVSESHIKMTIEHKSGTVLGVETRPNFMAVTAQSVVDALLSQQRFSEDDK